MRPLFWFVCFGNLGLTVRGQVCGFAPDGPGVAFLLAPLTKYYLALLWYKDGLFTGAGPFLCFFSFN